MSTDQPSRLISCVLGRHRGCQRVGTLPMPVRAIPWINVRWVKKKSAITGTVSTVVTAIIHPHWTPTVPKTWMPRESVYLLGSLR